MPTIDVGFRLTGREIPADHGYALYGAVSRLVPWTHDPAQEALGIHPINGLLAGNRLLHLTPSSRLTFRLDSDHVRELLPLAGKELDLDGHELRVGVPTTYMLKPAATLRSRLVTFKHRMETELEGREELTADRSPFIRRTIRIHDKEVVGFAMEVSGLSADESLRLQETGLGGRRKFGCGIFVPTQQA
jgi:CRISPR-associated protein Cas6